MIGTILLGTLVALAFGLIPQVFSPRTFGASIKYLVIAAIGNLILNSIIVYAFMPAMTGPLGGLEFLWFPFLVNAIIGFIIAYANNENGDEDNSTVNSLAATGNLVGLGLLGLVALIIAMSTTWGEGNAKALANFLPIEKVESKFSADTFSPDVMPDSDPEHIVMVEEGVARFNGSQATGSTGENLGAIYKPGTYTKQNVAGHLYWIAPLIYQNPFANLQNQTSPGFIVVDAENPNTKARLVTTHPLHYMPEALFNQDLVRHAYLNGWSGYRLIDATLEVDDNWVPFFTLDASVYQRGLYGVEVKKVLVINAETGAIQDFDLADKPAWIDRVLPLSAIDQNMDDYGNYYNAPWFMNTSGVGIETRADDSTPTAYSSLEASPVYQYVMTSKNATDFSSLGVVLVDSNKYEAKRYPIYGIAVGSKVRNAFLGVQDNITGKDTHKYEVTDPVLYNVYNRLTWVATYVTASSDGMSQYSMIGFLDAYNVGPANVQYAKTKEEALRKYQLWLANPPSDAVTPNSKSTRNAITGTIVTFSSEVKDGNTVYYFMLRGEDGQVLNTTFTIAPTDKVNEIRFTKVGDKVSFSYIDLQNQIGSVDSFDNLGIPPQ